jgi:hypothetical protein
MDPRCRLYNWGQRERGGMGEEEAVVLELGASASSRWMNAASGQVVVAPAEAAGTGGALTLGNLLYLLTAPPGLPNWPAAITPPVPAHAVSGMYTGLRPHQHSLWLHPPLLQPLPPPLQQPQPR